MLKKSVCKECVNTAAVAEKLMNSDMDLSWSSVDDRMWDEKFLFCPHKKQMVFGIDEGRWGKIDTNKIFSGCVKKALHRRGD